MIYIAGPISKEKNYMANFEKAELFLKSWGYAVYNPAKQLEYLPKTTEYKTYIQLGLRALMQCSDIYLLNKHWESPGANLEYKYAELTNMHIQYENQIIELLLDEYIRIGPIEFKKKIKPFARYYFLQTVKKVYYGHNILYDNQIIKIEDLR